MKSTIFRVSATFYDAAPRVCHVLECFETLLKREFLKKARAMESAVQHATAALVTGLQATGGPTPVGAALATPRSSIEQLTT